MRKTISALFLSACIGLSSVHASNALILQTDFSLKDGAVSAMKGVAFSVDSNLKIFDLTHEIPRITFGKALTACIRPLVIGQKVRYL